MNIKDMVIVGRTNNRVSPQNPYDCPTFPVYELRLVELAKRNDKKDMQSYFQEMHLSDTFLNPCHRLLEKGIK